MNTASSLARICRRLRLSLPRHDHSLAHGPWLEPEFNATLIQCAMSDVGQGAHIEIPSAPTIGIAWCEPPA